MKMLKYFAVFMLGLSVGCAPKRDYPTEHKQHISDIFAGQRPVAVESIVPPSGPFRLCKTGHYYYKATGTKEVYYVDVGISAWTAATVVLGSDQTIFKYTYYHRNRLGFYSKITY